METKNENRTSKVAEATKAIMYLVSRGHDLVTLYTGQYTTSINIHVDTLEHALGMIERLDREDIEYEKSEITKVTKHNTWCVEVTF